MITIEEQHLLDLLEECLPVLDFQIEEYNDQEAVGIMCKIELILKIAGRTVNGPNAR